MGGMAVCMGYSMYSTRNTIISPPADNVVDSDTDDLCSEELVAMDEVRISAPESKTQFG